MFLNQTIQRNPKLVDISIKLHQLGELEPDTYVIDLDTTLSNAKKILDEANRNNIKLYFMLKQVGRNPVIAKALMDMGYAGAVVVDYREASIMMDHSIPLGNVGHLVQTPFHNLERIIDYGTEVFTVMSFDKLVEIDSLCNKLDKKQDIILKVYDMNDNQYNGQEGGINLEILSNFIKEAKELTHVNIVGATAFPAFLYSEDTKNVEKTNNYFTIAKAIEIMRNHGLEIKQINMPSTTSVKTLKLMGETIATHGEPGHGLTGSTPMHAVEILDEVPSVLYLSEISHNFGDFSFAYGGGHYRRSHIDNALIVDKDVNAYNTHVVVPDSDSIDYYFKLNNNFPVSSTVLMAFRFQMFVTRSHIALVKDLHNDKPVITGIYDSLGKKVK